MPKWNLGGVNFLPFTDSVVGYTYVEYERKDLRWLKLSYWENLIALLKSINFFSILWQTSKLLKLGQKNLNFILIVMNTFWHDFVDLVHRFSVAIAYCLSTGTVYVQDLWNLDGIVQSESTIKLCLITWCMEHSTVGIVLLMNLQLIESPMYNNVPSPMYNHQCTLFLLQKAYFMIFICSYDLSL